MIPRVHVLLFSLRTAAVPPFSEKRGWISGSDKAMSWANPYSERLYLGVGHLYRLVARDRFRLHSSYVAFSHILIALER